MSKFLTGGITLIIIGHRPYIPVVSAMLVNDVTLPMKAVAVTGRIGIALGTILIGIEMHRQRSGHPK